ncbi:efflux transporter outer membrane subunit [Bordetella sp. N]|uniref:efflux transporter outer membrane subunit n=1 Tax=Bordetella sp. N TaxID=1746199 RepID=UPI00070EE5DA|nr:efflux transporter outer membrane subunit [Bordetella sp. N]ALM82860.1 RND transporter [Bordetella sp. N]
MRARSSCGFPTGAVPLMLVLAAALTGCNFAPEQPPPTVDLPARYADDADTATSRDASKGVDTMATATADQVSWQQFFGDPQLRLLIAYALQHNQDLAAAFARIDQARAFYRIEHANLLPRVDVGAGASRNQAPLAVVDPAFAGSTRSIEFNQFNLQVAVTSFELDFWGRVRNLNQAAMHQYLATVEGQRAFHLSLIANVAATYYDARASEEGVALAQRTLAARRYALGIARDRLDAGVTSTVDFEQAAILMTQAQAQLAEMQRAAAEAWNRLWVLAGGHVDLHAVTPNPIEATGQFEELSPGLPSALLLARPDIRQAEQRLAGADANIGAARAALFPSISLTGSLGYASTELAGLVEGHNQSWSIGAGIGMPIFDYGQRRAAVELARAQHAELVANYIKTVQSAFSEVATALERAKRLREQVAVQGVAIQAQQRLAETAELRYLNGISIYLEVMDARRNLFSAELQMLSLRAAALQNGVSLYVALGGGAEQRTGADGTVGTDETVGQAGR